MFTPQPGNTATLPPSDLCDWLRQIVPVGLIRIYILYIELTSIFTFDIQQKINRTELDWVCAHLSTVDVHKNHYRARSDVIEHTDIIKILVMQNTGLVTKFVKKLEDVQ